MRKTALGLGVGFALLAGSVVLSTIPGENADAAVRKAADKEQVEVELFTPEAGNNVGRSAKGFFVDLEAEFPTGVAATGAKEQLSGPAAHANTPPFPSPFGPGQDDAFPGLIVLLSTTEIGAGPGQNLAGLFNLTGFTDRKPGETEVWTTWIVGDSLFGEGRSKVYVAIAKDKDKNGVYDDAPASIPDSNGDGKINQVDLRKFGVASNIEAVPFRINARP